MYSARVMRGSTLLAALGALLLFGCSSSPETKTSVKSPEAPKAAGSDFKVALITPGPVSDAGWSALAYEGLKGVESELGAEVNNKIATGPQAKDDMRSYAQNGYKLVIGHGFEYNEPGVEVAKDFPDTVFISSSGGKTAANAGAFRFYLEQGCYLAGMVAGKMSKTGKVGSVAVLDIPSINSTLAAFEAGAKAARPDIQIVKTVYFGAEGDIAGAKRATQSVLAQGADFVIHQANAGAQGVFDACMEKGAYAIGTNSDQNDNSSGVVLGSATIVAKPAFLKLAQSVKNGTYKGSVVLAGMDQDAIDFVFNPKLMDKVPAGVAALVKETKAKIKSGDLVVPKAEF
ncbi:BMP family ABC transporter substrate-binding protein [bacterium]|nr:MAG: BMP family ABC transporter substrate-binding protein [bacterium]